MQALKKFLAWLLTLAMLVSLVAGMDLALVSYADSANESDFSYQVIDGEAMLTRVNINMTGALVIPSTLDDYPVTSISEWAFGSCTHITSITIPKFIKNIYGPFTGCTSLEEIVVEEGNPRYHSSGNCIIDTDAKTLIVGCKTSVIPDDGSVTIIDGSYIVGGAFFGCDGLTSITIPKSVTKIRSNAFAYCTDLVEVNYTGTMEEWCNISFDDPESNPVSYSHNLNIDGEQLTNITLQNGVENIRNYVFSGLTDLESIYIPSSVKEISAVCFLGCHNLSIIHVDNENEVYHAKGNCLIETATKTLIAGCKASVIPDDNSVTSIASCAFKCCTGLTSIAIPDTVTSIGSSAFYNCSQLSDLSIGCGLIEIRDDTFEGTAWLQNQPDGMVYVGNILYKYKGEMPENTTLELREDTCSIIDSCFANYSCSKNLNRITIPAGMKKIQEWAFSGCQKLIDVNYTGTIEQWCNIEFETYYANPLYYAHSFHINNSLVTHLRIPNGIEKIGTGQFSGCSSFSSVEIPDSVNTIEHYAFMNCTGLVSVSIPDSVTNIQYEAFYNCSSLETIQIPDCLVKIGANAFVNTAWYNKQSDGLIYINKVAYKYKGMMAQDTHIRIKDGTLCIADSAFYNYSGLTSITFPDSLTNIGNFAFSHCTGLTKVISGKGITQIGEFAFSRCQNLISIELSNQLKKISYGQFEGCESLTQIVIPKNISSIERYAFYGCSQLTDVYYTGSQEEWEDIEINNEYDSNEMLLNANKHFDYVPHVHEYSPWLMNDTNHWRICACKDEEAGEHVFTNYTCEVCGLRRYTITYNLNGGNNSAVNPNTYTYYSSVVVLQNPTRKGYTFKGWYSDSNLTKKVTKIATGSTGNKTLYAKWAKTYTITYKLNGGTNSKSIPKRYTKIDSTITLKNPTRKGYTFKGWYSDSKYKKKVTKIASGSTGNKTLYAKWVKNTYKITYKLNSGKNSTKNPKTYTVTTKTITLKNPTRKGYVFQGWYSDAKFTKKVTKITKGSTGNKTLYAKWKKK